MKKSVILSAVFVAIALVVNAQPKYTHPSYSSANYKMPHNAKVAKDLNLDNTKSYEYTKGDAQAGNYKNTFNKVEDAGGAVPILPTENQYGLANNGNYKMQFKATKKVIKSDEIVKPEPVAIVSPQ